MIPDTGIVSPEGVVSPEVVMSSEVVVSSDEKVDIEVPDITSDTAIPSPGETLYLELAPSVPLTPPINPPVPSLVKTCSLCEAGVSPEEPNEYR